MFLTLSNALEGQESWSAALLRPYYYGYLYLALIKNKELIKSFLIKLEIY